MGATKRQSKVRKFERANAPEHPQKLNNKAYERKLSQSARGACQTAVVDGRTRG